MFGWFGKKKPQVKAALARNNSYNADKDIQQIVQAQGGKNGRFFSTPKQILEKNPFNANNVANVLRQRRKMLDSIQ